MPGRKICVDCKKQYGIVWEETTQVLPCDDCAEKRREAKERDQESKRKIEEMKVQHTMDKTMAELKAQSEKKQEEEMTKRETVKEKTKQLQESTKLKIAEEQTRQIKAEESVVDKWIHLEQEQTKRIQAEEKRDKARAEREIAKLVECRKILEISPESEADVRQFLREGLGGNAHENNREYSRPTTLYARNPNLNRRQPCNRA